MAARGIGRDRSLRWSRGETRFGRWQGWLGQVFRPNRQSYTSDTGGCTSDTGGCSSDTGGQVRLRWVGRRLGSRRVERQGNRKRERRDAAARKQLSTMKHWRLRDESIAEACRPERRTAIGRMPERS